ncbi:Protein PGR [Paramyrothecium foliicola]|nr:Protein PGR [Paramyrothecium foliicola]
MHPYIAVPATCALVYRAWSKKSLTPAGLVAATLTAVAHAYHPWNLPFLLLCVFFLAGTRATHINEEAKSRMTMRSKGTSGGEGPRTHVQVLANSLMASILTVLHAIQLRSRQAALLDPNAPDPNGTLCFSWRGDLLVVGIIANYAAVAADTFSSELGILAKGDPRLITSLTLRKVPRGTNGGVTLTGLAAGLFGSIVIVTSAMVFLPACNPRTMNLPAGGTPWTTKERRDFMTFMVLWGTLGSVLDSVLGGLFQQSVKDTRSGKIVEGEGGVRALVSPEHDPSVQETKERTGGTTTATGGQTGETKARNKKDKPRRPSFGDERPSRIVENGWDLLDNNDVNFIMAVVMSVGGMAAMSWYWDIPIQSVLDGVAY